MKNSSFGRTSVLLRHLESELRHQYQDVIGLGTFVVVVFALQIIPSREIVDHLSECLYCKLFSRLLLAGDKVPKCVSMILNGLLDLDYILLHHLLLAVPSQTDLEPKRRNRPGRRQRRVVRH